MSIINNNWIAYKTRVNKWKVYNDSGGKRILGGKLVSSCLWYLALVVWKEEQTGGFILCVSFIFYVMSLCKLSMLKLERKSWTEKEGICLWK